MRAGARGARRRLGTAPECIPARVVYNTGTMRSFGSRRFTRVASLVAAAFVLCLGIFLSWPAAGSSVTAHTTVTGSLHVDRGYSGGGHQMDVAYLAVASDEVDDSSKAPVNAGLLTAVLLAACFAAAVGWLLSNGAGQGLFRSWRLALQPSFAVALEDAPFLNVFRL